MVTKTLTITEDAYNLLAENKLEDESFSKEIVRILAKKRTKTIHDFIGIISEEERKAMQKDLKEIKEFNLKALPERLV
jgi:predicted CopG family antitoxin